MCICTVTNVNIVTVFISVVFLLVLFVIYSDDDIIDNGIVCWLREYFSM